LSRAQASDAGPPGSRDRPHHQRVARHLGRGPGPQ
jgi:hypothetical protein